jgi:3D (Asp-Asp-Asp) domain-containing protein
MIKRSISIYLLIAFLSWPTEADALSISKLAIVSPLNAGILSYVRNTGAANTVQNQIISDDGSEASIIHGNSIIASHVPNAVKTRYFIARKKQTLKVAATAYSSTPDQTDSNPFITASGTYVRDGIIAANFLPFGTVIKIPDLFGDKTFVVEDRMHERFDIKIDIWFETREQAKQFGIKTVRIEIVS